MKVVDVRDSDEDMEDSDEESEEDDGSVYVPSGTPSEAGGEELDDNEDLMEATPKDDCDFLELLPRELRDRVRTRQWPFLHMCLCSEGMLTCLDLRIRPQTGYFRIKLHT